MKKLTIVPMILIMIAILAFPGAVSAGGRPFSTTLTGEAEVTPEGVPNQGDLDGIGTAHLTLNQGQGQICYELTVSGIAPATAAHIHVGASTTTGGVVVPLAAPTDGSSSGCADVDPELIKAIRQNPENYYVNVHNAEFPGGALRGQLSK
jgi:hypothetical protein